MSPDLRNRILAVAAASLVAGAGVYQAGEQGRIDDAAIKIAREVGQEYESSGRHIGKPYIDRAEADAKRPKASLIVGLRGVLGGHVAACS